jgi:cobalt/nickel transport protein
MKEIVLRYKKAFILILFLIVISPIFGVILANLLGYHEPLDVAAEFLGLNETTEEINWTPFVDYSVPGLPPEVGYIVSGLLGALVVLLLGYIIIKLRK